MNLMRNAAAFVLALTLGLNACASTDQPLTLAEVLESSLQHFPAIQSAVEERLLREGRTLAARGAFDLALEQDSLIWADGFYDGLSADQRLVKPLPFANAKTYAGYRVTNDDFPIYEQELVTNDGGEFNFGFALSLWRDRAIDKRRFAIENAERSVREAELDLALAQLTTQRNAARAYWAWMAAGHRHEVYRMLTELAISRMDGLERRAEAGDVANITVVENRQNLLRRQAALTNAKRDFELTAIELSLYLRDAQGDPLKPADKRLPSGLPDPGAPAPDANTLAAGVLAQRPEVGRIDNQIALEQKRLLLARNELMPRVDFGFKLSHDIGAGSITREGAEAKVDLSISIPLERRRGRGRVSETESRLRQLELDRRLLVNRLENEIHKLVVAIDAAHEFVDITTEEADQATLLEQAERKRFGAGASDFFVVNLREERTADARIRNIESRLTYFNKLTDLQAISLDFAALGLGTVQ